LSLEDTSETVGLVDFGDAVERTGVGERESAGLSLETCRKKSGARDVLGSKKRERAKEEEEKKRTNGS